MPLNYIYHKSKSVVYVKAYGVLNIDDVLTYFNQVLCDTSIKDGFVEVIDFSEIVSYDFADHFSTRLHGMCTKLVAKGSVGVIVYAKTSEELDQAMNLLRSMSDEIVKADLPVKCVKTLDEMEEYIEVMKNREFF